MDSHATDDDDKSLFRKTSKRANERDKEEITTLSAVINKVKGGLERVGARALVRMNPGRTRPTLAKAIDTIRQRYQRVMSCLRGGAARLRWSYEPRVPRFSHLYQVRVNVKNVRPKFGFQRVLVIGHIM